LGSGCGLTVTFTLISDLYSGKDAKRVTSYTTSAFAIMPGLAIIVGDLVSVIFTWRACFVLMVVYSLALLLFTTCLPSITVTKEASSAKLVDLGRDFRKYILAALIWGLCGAIIYTLSATLPIIVVKYFSASSTTFGVYYGACMVGYFVGNIITARLSGKATTGQVLVAGVVLNIISAILFALSSFSVSLVLFFLPLFFLFISLPMIFSTLIAQTMQLVDNKAISSAILAFLCMSISVVVSMLVGTIEYGLKQKQGLIVLGVCLAIAALTYLSIRKLKRIV
jgi:DHA1 family bicyclomycin/chloramphenicol resistance-like MFS transporter